MTVNDFYQNGKNITDGSALIDSMSNSSFEGTRGDQIFIGDDATRDRDYAIKYYNNLTSEFVVRYLHSTEQHLC